MKAMVFAAGYGERLRPTTEKTPKALVPVGGRPMIDYSLLLLAHYGIREIMVNVHYLGDQIETYLNGQKDRGLRIHYSREKELLDTGGGLFKARSFFQDGTFVAVNCDVIIDLPLMEVIQQHRRRQATATLVLRQDPDADRYGAIEISNDSKIQRFLQYKTPTSDSAGDLRKLMFTGVQILEPKVFDVMEQEASPKFSTTKSIYPRLLFAGERLDGFTFDGYWQDLGTAHRIKDAEEKLRRREVKLHYL